MIPMTADAPLLGYRYQLHERLGAGSMGAVYRATDRLTGQTVALKRVLTGEQDPDSTAYESSMNRAMSLAREFQLLASLRHPNIISVLDYGFDAERQPFYTMTLIEPATTLRRAAHGLDIAQKVELLIPVLQALNYLHRRGITHRDLKPSNIMVDAAGTVRVLDFGLAIDRQQAGQMAGTLHYIAPEVLRGKSATPASDLYAFGIITYEILTGEHPFDTSSNDRLIQQVFSGYTPDVSMLPPLLGMMISRLLMPDPDDRYPSAQDAMPDLCGAVNRPLPLETHAIRESYLQASRFVGREHELSLLTDSFEAARGGDGSAWLVGGESGVGKSRLINELTIRAQVDGALVLRGQSVQGGGLLYQMWREPIRQLALTVDLTDLEAGILVDIVPDIDRLLNRPIPAPPEVSGAPRQDRLMQTLVNLFRRASRLEMPTLLILEDLHWASEGLEPLRHLYKLAPGLPLMIVATYRDDERPDLPELLDGMTLLSLERLTLDEIERLSIAMLGNAGSQPDVLALLEQETEGNVFFLVEVVRALAEEAGRLDAVGTVTLPQRVMAGGVREVIRRRLEAVPQWGQPLLQLAAVAGRQVDAALMANINSKESLLPPEHTLEDWLTACIHASVFRAQEDLCIFDHDKLREAMLESLAPDARRWLHRATAQGIERLYGENPQYTGILVDHWHAAGDREREWRYARRYGRQLKAISLYREALVMFHRVLDLLPEDQYALERVELLYEIGESNLIISQHDLAADYFTRCLELAGQIGARRAEAAALRGLGRLDNLHGDNARFEERFAQSLAIAREIDDKGGIASSLKELAFAYEIRGEYDRAMAQHEEAIALYRGLNDRMGIGSVLNDMGIIHALRGDNEAAAVCWSESLEIKREIGDRRGAAATLMNLGLLYKDTSRYDEAIDYLQESLMMWRDIGNLQAEAAALNNLAATLQDMGLYDDARAYQEESIRIKREIGDMQGLADSLNAMGLLEMYQGNYREAVRLAEEVLPMRRELGDLRGLHATLSLLAFVRSMLTRQPQTELVRELVEIALRMDTPPVSAATAMILARFAWLAGDAERSACWLALLDRLEPHPTRSVRFILESFRSNMEAEAADSLDSARAWAAQADVMAVFKTEI